MTGPDGAAVGAAGSDAPIFLPGASADLIETAGRFPLKPGTRLGPGDWVGAAVDYDRLPWRLVPLWDRRDAAIEEAARGFWVGHGFLTLGQAEARLPELVTVAFAGNAVAGVATAYEGAIEGMPGRYAFYRNIVAPDQRRGHLGLVLTGYSRMQVERWAAEHPERGVLGMAATVQQAVFNPHHAKPVWPMANLNLIARLADGGHLRIAWFPAARLAANAA